MDSNDHNPGLADAELRAEIGRWNARDVTYIAGSWQALARFIPHFTTEDFRAHPAAPPNPYLRAVIRQPLTPAEAPIPVGIVSNTYRLAQHTEVIEQCLAGLQQQRIAPDSLRCEVGLSTLGEWMNFRAYFPENWSYPPDQEDRLALRLECFNSVDGSSRLIILLGWLRFVCSNGMVIGETRAEIREIHDPRLDLARIPQIIADALHQVDADRQRLHNWRATTFGDDALHTWVNNDLATAWGKKAACRVFHICIEGADVEITNPFDASLPTRKPTQRTVTVPGAPAPAYTLYDVSQALSWVATHRTNVEERIEWQSQIPALIAPLAATELAASHQPMLFTR